MIVIGKASDACVDVCPVLALTITKDGAEPDLAPAPPGARASRAQVAGAATYVDDIPELRGTLHAAPILSTVAHGRLRGVDADEAALAAFVDEVTHLIRSQIAGIVGNHEGPMFEAYTAISALAPNWLTLSFISFTRPLSRCRVRS